MVISVISMGFLDGILKMLGLKKEEGGSEGGSVETPADSEASTEDNSPPAVPGEGESSEGGDDKPQGSGDGM